MNVKQLARSAAVQAPPIRRLVEDRATYAALAVSLERRLTEAEGALEDARSETAATGEALLRAEERSAYLEGKLEDAAKPGYDFDGLIAAATGRGRYKSCTWIEEGVFFTERAVNICCMQSVGNQTPHLFDLEGTTPDFAAIQWAKQKFRVANQTKQAPCGGCYLLQEKEWQAQPHLTFIGVSGFLHCNLSCSYCVSYDFDPKSRGANVFDVIKSLHAQGALKRDVSRIEWGGGESTFHRDFAKVAAFAGENGVQMTVYTNATAYVPALEAGLRSGLFNVVVSVDAGFADTYKRIKGRDFLDKVWSNLDRYAALNPAQVKLKYIVMEANCAAAELDEFLRRALLSKAGVLIVSPNAHNNEGADFQVSEAVEEASVYLYAKGKAAGLYVGASEFFEPGLRSRIEARAHESADKISLPPLLLRNMSPPMEIAFVDSPPFYRRLSGVVQAHEDVRIVLPQPVSIAAAPSMLQRLICAGGADTVADDPAGAVPDLSGYKLKVMLKGERVTALDLRRI